MPRSIFPAKKPWHSSMYFFLILKWKSVNQSLQKKPEGNNGGGALQTLKVRFFYKIVWLTGPIVWFKKTVTHLLLYTVANVSSFFWNRGYLHHINFKIFFHPAKFDNFKDEKISNFKTVSVSQSKNLLDWKLVV